MERQIELIGAAWGLGGADPGCADAPEALIPQVAESLARCGSTVVLGPLLLPEYRAPQPGRLDLTSAGMSVAAVLTVIYGLKEIAHYSWKGVSLRFLDEFSASLRRN